MEAPDSVRGSGLLNPAENARTYELRALALVAASDAVCDFFRSLSEKRCLPAGQRQTEVFIGQPGGHPSSRSAIQKADLD